MNSTRNKINNIIARTINVDIGSLNDNSGLNNITEWDSVNHTNIILSLEQEFDIEFGFDEFDKLINLKCIEKSIIDKLNENNI